MIAELSSQTLCLDFYRWYVSVPDIRKLGKEQYKVLSYGATMPLNIASLPFICSCTTC